MQEFLSICSICYFVIYSSIIVSVLTYRFEKVIDEQCVKVGTVVGDLKILFNKFHNTVPSSNNETVALDSKLLLDEKVLKFRKKVCFKKQKTNKKDTFL